MQQPRWLWEALQNKKGSLVVDASDGRGCFWLVIFLGACVIAMRSGCHPWGSPQPDPVAVHRQRCMKCVKIDDQLLVIEQLEQKSAGLLGSNQEVCGLCKQGLIEVYKVGLLIDAAREAGCVGVDEYRQCADSAAESFRRSMSWYRCE